MKKLITKAEKKSISAFKKELVKRRGGAGLSDFRAERYLRYFYFKEFWKIFYQLFARQFGTEGCDCTTLDSVSTAFRKTDLKQCTVRNLRAWAEVRLAHNTFRILESEGVFYIVAASMDAFPITMHVVNLVAAVIAYDDYTGDTDFSALLDQVILEIEAEEKSKHILTMTARPLVEDVLKGESVRFDVRQQKNGRLCCTIYRWASWLPDKVFRTSFDTFREDFIKAYKDFKLRNRNCICF